MDTTYRYNSYQNIFILTYLFNIPCYHNYDYQYILLLF